MTTRLELLASASTAGLRAGAFPSNEPIDVRGRAALARLEGEFRACDKVLRSPALAAAETAEGLALDATPEPAFRDCDFGRWAGRALSEIEAEEPEALALWLSDPRAAPHGGESFAELLDRVGAWMDALSESSGAILAITHAAIIRAAIAHALCAESSAVLHIDAAPLTRATFSGARGCWRFGALLPLKEARSATKRRRSQSTRTSGASRSEPPSAD